MFACITKINAQQFNFHPLPDGPIKACYNVMQDKRGYIWITTEKGLCRYDGKTYKWFNKTSDGTPFFFVFQIAEALNGDIIFNTLDSRLGCVHNDSVSFLPLSKTMQTIMEHGRFQILGMYFDKKQVLWLSTGAGLYRTKKANDYSDVELVKEPSIADTCTFGIHVIDNTKAMGFLTGSHIGKGIDKNDLKYGFFSNHDNRIVKGRYTVVKTDMQPAYVKGLLLDNGNILLCVEKRIEILHPDGSVTEKMMDGNVLNLYKDKTGGIWICCWKKGVAYYADQSLNGTPVWSLNGQDASSITEDSEGGFWVSTISSGVFYADSKYVIDYSNISGLGLNAKSVYTYNNKVLVNNSDNYLTVIQGSNIKQVSLKLRYTPSVVSDYCVCGRYLYVAGTVCSVSDTSLDEKWLPVLEKRRKTEHSCYNLTFAPDHKLYSVSYFNLMSINDGSFELLDTVPDRGHCLCAIEDGRILLGTSKGLYSRKDGKMTYIGGIDKSLEGTINVIKEAKTGTVWIGTSIAGVVEYKENKVIANYTVESGLASDFVNDIAFDDSGNVWVATDNGLSKIMPGNAYNIESYDTRNGLITADIAKISISGNLLWMGTKLGVNSVDIIHISPNKLPPPVYINAVFVNDSLSFNTYDFSHRFNNFRFQLAGLTFKDNKTHFLYRLSGLDSAWHNSANPEVSYNNLPPGKYNFQAKAVNANGINSSQAASFTFKIELPFWLRWWFIALEIGSAVTLVYLFILYRLNVIQAKEAEKSRINKMIAEYQMTALSAQMNPHFVFNAINSIQDYILGNDTQKAYDYLTKFAQLVRIILDNAKEKAISLEKELESLNAYVQLEQLRFHNTFDFKLKVDKEVDVFTIEVPSMIIQPYVENAIWHGLMPLGNLRKGALNIDIRQIGNLLQITIEDNGIGREESNKIRKSTGHKSVGMQITKKRIEVLNSLLGAKGSEINIYDLYENQVEPAGTRVEIKIVVNTD